MKNHEMSLNSIPFEAIKAGIQLIETRINDEKRQLVNPGDTITFFKRPECVENYTVEVSGKSVFQKFIDLFSAINEISFGYPEDTTPQEMTDNMRKYYSKEEEEKYGVVGLHIKPI